MLEVTEKVDNREVENFLNYIHSNKKIFSRSINHNYSTRKKEFSELGSVMIDWAKKYLGDNYLKTLADGYASFVIDVNKSQMKYEKEKHYQNKTYQQVYESVYNNEAHMNLYHWGVYVTTFAWKHHLDIYTFFKNYFVGLLPNEGKALDLGSGSGIWSMLLSSNAGNWQIKGIDISQRSISLSSTMAEINGFGNLNFELGDALTFKGEQKFDACTSCFLLEHLETPDKLFQNISENLKPGGYAFMTGALTAAEVDHIFEFYNESELIKMAEEKGFRVIASFSSAPDSHARDFHFLPRSMAMVLQKKVNTIW